MKKSLLFIFLIIFTVSLHAQKDTINYIGAAVSTGYFKDTASMSML